MARPRRWAVTVTLTFLLAIPVVAGSQPQRAPAGNTSAAPAKAVSGNESAPAKTGTANDSVVTTKAPELPTPAPRDAASDAAAIGHLIAILVVAAVVFILAVATYRVVKRFIVELDARASLGTRGHWGGFGGADTGWEVSPALALLVAALVLALVTAALGGALVSMTTKSERETSAGSGAKAPAGK